MGGVSGKPTKVSQFTNDSGYITSAGSCNYANSAGNGVESSGSGWIRFKDGTQICYLSTSCSSSGEVKSLPNSFKNSDYIVILHHDIDVTQIYVNNKTTTRCTVYNGINGFVIYDLIAIGRWK